MRTYFLFCVCAFLFVGCANVDAVKSSNAPPTPPPSPIQPTIVALNQIDLSRIGSIGGKGRAQDRDYHDDLPVVSQLLAHGKEAIPFLISRLDDETRLDYQIVDYWKEAYVGDVAFVLLTDFFLGNDEETSTIKGMDWDTFLGRGNNQHFTGEELLRRYIKRHGRKKIKQRWRDVWEENKDRIYWDEERRNFRLTENEVL